MKISAGFREVLGGPNGAQNRVLRSFFRSFFRMRFRIDFGCFFGGSQPEKSLKTIGFSMVFVNFHKIHIFEKIAKQLGFLSGFGKLKLQKKKEKNMVLKNIFF